VAETPAQIDLKLRKTNFAAQLTSTDWFISMPGTAGRNR
jgi:hypothetical protein